MYIGVDIGGTKVAAGLADEKGEIKAQKEIVTVKDNIGSFVDSVVSLINDLLQEAGSDEVEAIGLGIPGMVSCQSKIINAPNLAILEGIDLVKLLQKKVKAKYFVGNDANLAALAEMHFGAGKNNNNFVYLTISTGIGGGIVIDRKLYKGHNGTAGEFGHMMLFPDGPKCGCGNKGCWEALGSGTAIANMAKVKIKEEGIKSKIADLVKGDLEKITARIVAQAAAEKDQFAIDLFQINGFYNGLGIVNVVNTFDPEVVIIGGGLSFNNELFFEPLEKALKMFSPMTPDKKINIVPAKFHKDSGMIGAIALCLENTQ